MKKKDCWNDQDRSRGRNQEDRLCDSGAGVDNGSTDSTARLASEAGADVISEPVRGYGKALKRGFSTASGDVIVTADADATYPLEAIPSLLDTFARDGLDFLTTNRFAALDESAMSIVNRSVTRYWPCHEASLWFGHARP